MLYTYASFVVLQCSTYIIDYQHILLYVEIMSPLYLLTLPFLVVCVSVDLSLWTYMV